MVNKKIFALIFKHSYYGLVFTLTASDFGEHINNECFPLLNHVILLRVASPLYYRFSVKGDLHENWNMVKKKSKTPVYTYNIGAAYSGGFFIFICGHRRFSYKHSDFLFHEGSVHMVMRDAGKFKNFSDFYKKQLKQLEEITIENTKITKEDYEKHRNDDWWIMALEAKEKGICDEII